MLFCFSKLCLRLFLLSATVLLFGQMSSAYANTFSVNSTADVVDANPGDGKCETGRDAPRVTPPTKECTLRAAIQESNALSGKDEIILPAGTYLLSQATQCAYRLKDNPNLLTGSGVNLCITGQLVISGTDANTTIIDGAQLARIFFVSADAQAEIRGVTVQRGRQTDNIFDFQRGGGINNQGSLTLIESVVSGNSADSGAGGIFNTGTLTLNKSAVTGNTAIPNLGEGGGIYNYYGKAIITDSLISGNTSSNNGAGLSNYFGAVTITGSAFSDNTTGSLGGGIVNFYGTTTIINSTFSGNSANSGGALNNNTGTLTNPAVMDLSNVTVTQNRSRGGAGGGLANGGSLALKNTLIAGNVNDTQQAPDCYSAPQPLQSKGHNLIQNTTFCGIAGDQTGNITGQDAQLGILANNGGLTPTHALLAASPAVNAGAPNAPGSGGAACAAADQRGLLRPLGSRCDIGAFERDKGFSVSGALPNRGGNAGSIIGVISGSSFVGGAAVKLRRTGEQDIAGAPATVEAGGSSLATSFDLSGKTKGAWDVVVTNPDGASAILSNGFTIEETRAPQLWSHIVGRSAIRPGLPAKYNIVYGNRGNVDAHAVPLTLAVPANLQLNVYFQFAPPPVQAGQVPTNWSEVPVDVLPGRATGANTNVVMLLPVIPAGSTGVIRISLTLPPEATHGDTITFAAYLGDPYFEPNLDSAILDGMVAGAQSRSQRALGVTIPPALLPELKRYATTQLQSLVESDRQALVESLATQPEVYSLAQLSFDLARFGAARATGANVSFIGASKADTSWASLSGIGPISNLEGGAGGKPGSGCAGQILAEGQSCGDNPKPVPTPDKIPPGPPGIPKGDCNDIPNHQLSSDGTQCIPKDRRGCPTIPSGFFADPGCLTIPIRQSVDPNDKVGAPGAMDKRFRQSATPLSYAIYFENKPTATAPAQVVTITDQLDAANLDLSTFSFGPISFDKYRVTPPLGRSEFVAALDLRPANNLIVKMDARLDKTTGLLTLRFTSLDPTTQEPTADPAAGFLAPNLTAPEGEGSVTFFVNPKPGLATGAEIRNKARIVFDVNSPIDTPEWLNTIDDAKPTSRALALPARQNTPSFILNWAGTDAGAGIASYTIYVSQNGGPYTAFLTDTPLTTATFDGTLGSTYAFYSVATDLAGNVEPAKNVAEATTTLAAPLITQFSQAGYSVGEGAGNSNITITRTGDLSAPATVEYATSDGTASNRSDYNTTIGRLRFAAGESSKSFSVLILDDAYAEGTETLTLTLSNPTGGAALGAPAVATLSIADNDAATSNANPLDATAFFVRQQYVDFLSREPDTAGLAFWSNGIESCGADQQCREVKRVDTSAAFFLSIEFQETGFLVHRLYRAAFNRLTRYREFIRDTQEIGRGVVVGAPGWEAKLEANKIAFVTEFAARADVHALYEGLTHEKYVDALNTNTGGSLSQAERDVLVAGLNAGAETRASALRKVAEDADLRARETSPAFVLLQYFGYLRRDPDAAPDADFAGYNFWLGKLNQFNGDFRQAEMVKAFLSSIEHRQRFGQP